MLMRRCLLYLLALLLVTACNDEFGNDNPKQNELMPSRAQVKFLRLQDDSTNVAGVLEINAQMPSVKLKWDVTPEYNLDTTTTEIQLSGGKYNLPIKWAEKLKEGTYGPIYSAYIAGVHIIAGSDSRYVPLVWADEVDSLKMVEIAEQRFIQTRSGEERDTKADGITLPKDLPIQLDKENGGDLKFSFNNLSCNLAKAELQTLNTEQGFNLDMTKINTVYFGSPAVVELRWAEGGAPEINFMGHLRLSIPGISKYAYFQYKVPEPLDWEFIECIPDTLEPLPAKDATIVAIVNTNRIWSLRYRMEDGRDSIVTSSGKVEGEQSLIFRLPDNTSLSSRNILIDVYSEDTKMNTLRFTQKSAEGSFSIQSVVPAPADGNLSAEAQTIKVTVDTARDWWISYDGVKHNFLATDAIGEVLIPAYDGTTSRNVIITVGYDNTLVETYSYTQVIGDELEYDNSNMPSEIIVDGGTYTFYFHGSYKGNLQVRAVLSDGTVIATSPSTTNKEPSMVIPNNYNSLENRTLIFEYKKGTEPWAPLNESNRVQSKAEFHYDVLPAGNIPREGITMSGVFSGSYRGTVFMKAVTGDTVIDEKSGATPGSINLLIDELTGTDDRVIEFFYSLDNGVTWNSMGRRTQIAGTINVGTLTPEGNIPAEGGPYHCSFSGTYPGDITFRARTETTTLATQTGKLPIRFELLIPANEATEQRTVVFEYSKNGTDWTTVDTRVQTSNIPVGGGDNNVGDYEDGENIEGGKEL